MSDTKDYLFVLKALEEIPFNVGKKLLTEFLTGKETNESIKRNKLYNKEYFGCLAYSESEIGAMIDGLVTNGLIQTVSIKGNRFWKVLELNTKGRKELKDPSMYKRKLAFNFKENKTTITEEEHKIFDVMKGFLSKYNDEQKKSIICPNKNILCIAGAGSGKTSVLTKRIEFLINYKGVEPKKILAITFTRKARQEMMNRLNNDLISVETFNSFCEKILRRYNDLIYKKIVRVISYRDKIGIINRALKSMHTSINNSLNIYFSYAQRRGKTNEQLASIFMNDCFFIRDYFKFKNRPLEESFFEYGEHKDSIRLVLGVCNYIESFMKRNGLRDFADQMIDALQLFKTHKELIPEFDHILIDEYQDVNSTQIELIDTLNPKNLFCVGDPRQSIYGWRGSDIRYILNFEDKYPNCEIITLTKNYRSTKHIVELINNSIKNMGLLDLESSIDGEKEIRLLKFKSAAAELEFVVQGILSSTHPNNEIFVLARTNRQLTELSQSMKLRGIKHVVRSDEVKRMTLAGKDDVTLATIHAIKGLEAEQVFVIGCNGINFPCRGSEHPVIDMVKVEEYDKEEEERRLFYVAMSRAKSKLYLSYSGKSTYFITEKMLEIMDEKTIKIEPKSESTKYNKSKFNVVKSNDVMIRLKEWRKSISSSSGLPAYMVMHDRTIIDISVNTPLTLEDLQKVHGMGPAKIMKYGEEILNVIRG